jgi:hypothetical protein
MADKVLPHAVPTLYRRLLKLYIRKFDTDTTTIVKAWRQTKHEFYHYRAATAEEVPVLLKRGNDIHHSISAGVIPMYENPKTGVRYAKYDKETLAASGNVIDPMSGEEYLRKNYKKFDADELKMMQQKLVDSGRWDGPLEFTDDDMPKIKTKKKRCTNPAPDDVAAALESEGAPPKGA